MGKLKMMKFKYKSVLGVSLATLVLAGCSLTPEPISLAEHEARVANDITKLYVDQEKISEPITMYEAMARALKYNMDNRLKIMEEVLASQQLSVAKMGLLPDLTVNAGYAGRNKPDASRSANLDTDQRGASYSYSDDEHGRTADLGLSWNVLDFGLSYIRAKQIGDRFMITKERRRKVVHNIVQDVRSAYWNALSAQRLLKKIEPFQAKIDRALKRSKEISDARLRPALETLQYRRNLLETLQQLKVLRSQLMASKTQLATLMNVAPGTDFELKDNDEVFSIPEVKVGLKELEQTALINRPELREEAYQSRISAQDVTRAMIGMIPGLSLNYKLNYDSNSFNKSQNWADWGVSISYNLLEKFTEGPAAIQEAEDQLKVVETRRLALSMAVLSQLHISYANFQQMKDEFTTSVDLHDVNRGILRETKNVSDTQTEGDLRLIEAELNSLIAEVRRDVSYADMLNAAGRIFVSVGADPLPDTIEDHSIETLSDALKDRLDGWYAGKINVNPKMVNDGEEASKDVSALSSSSDEKSQSKGFFDLFKS